MELAALQLVDNLNDPTHSYSDFDLRFFDSTKRERALPFGKRNKRQNVKNGAGISLRMAAFNNTL